MNLKVVVKLLGYLVLVLGGSMAFSVAWGIYYGEADTWALVKAMAVCAAAGLAMIFACRGTGFDDIKRRESILFVSLGWIVGALFSALPFLFATHSPGFNGPADAYFEAMSGLTTTGASILQDVSAVSNCILFWRSFTHWIGGMGIIVLFVAVMPYLGVTGKQMMRSEVPGPKMDGLRPRIIETARTLWLIYVGLSAAEALLLMLFGMDLFDALCHTFSTMATGGFSTKNLSIGHYESIPISLIVTLFMIAAGTNFTLYYMVLVGKGAQVWRNTELKTYLAIITIATALITVDIVAAQLHEHIHVSVVHSVFQVVSILTTTGFSSTDFETWPYFSKMLILMLMFVGGCSGSTGGGIKVIRILVIGKHAMQSVFRTVHPEAVLTMRIGGTLFRTDMVYQILGFFAWAIGIFAVGSLVVASFGHDMLTSASATAATLWNIGPGFALVGPVENYSFFSPFIKFFLSFLMVLGRLEIFTVIVLFSRAFWKKWL